jgi:hypothetical protein
MRYAVSRGKCAHRQQEMGRQYGFGLMISGPAPQPSQRIRYNGRGAGDMHVQSSTLRSYWLACAAAVAIAIAVAVGFWFFAMWMGG